MKPNTLKTAVLFFGMILFVSTNLFGQDKHQRPEKPPTIEKLFEDLDENDDDKLSKKEIKGPLKDHFSVVDTNKDGFLTKEELEKVPKPKGRKPQEERN
ncbi:EF-hand domain-containing protein [Flavivirga rizhaonensis]|uniref:EF-hand domain-containing protein n=1 Tax=Flavivirga rizhaonensis TaxID=2559571 RepID=A0A4S1DX13_9FLAO|nr:EF-hand domain-containing protein [Flavivirga rizhaonensis]TGV02686.1 EF-hand domain-containing protein [Flavivirga rizhaonensis]